MGVSMRQGCVLYRLLSQRWLNGNYKSLLETQPQSNATRSDSMQKKKEKYISCQVERHGFQVVCDDSKRPLHSKLVSSETKKTKHDVILGFREHTSSQLY